MKNLLLSILVFISVFICSNILLGEEEAPFVPLADKPEQLKQLDPKEPIWIATDRTQVVLVGTICLREGALEFFACRERTKEHESIVVLGIKPHLIHAALLLIGAKQGKPAQFTPTFVPPFGEKIAIHIRWKDELGRQHEVRAQEWIREVKTHQEMNVPWVFTGGLFGTNTDGKRYYLADLSGEIFGVSNFPGSILDIPIESTSDNNNLVFEPNTEKIPPIGTRVTLILTHNRSKN